jgi:paraquat-inducible protein B
VALVIDPKIMQARIPVYLKLEPDRVMLASGSTGPSMLRKLIEAGLKAKLESESLVTGQMLVDLDFAPNETGHVVDGADPEVPEIPAIPSDLQELRRQLTHAPIADTVVQAKQTLAAVEKLANRLDGEIVPLAVGVHGVLDSATRTLDTARTSIEGLQRDATATLDEVDGLAADGRRQLAARGQELSRTLATADKTLQHTDDLMVAANGVLARGSRTRDDLEATLRDLAASASALRDLSQAIDRDPSIVLRGRGAR